MVGIFIGDTAPSKIYVGGSEVVSVWAGDTKVRPTYSPRTFTITWTEQSNMSSGWTYSDDAAGLTAGDTAFDEFFGYSAVKLNTSGVETAEVTQTTPGTLNITQLGTLYGGDNIMIKFPVRGIKMSKSGSVVTLSITEDTNKAGYQYYAFNRNGTIVDKMYLGAYYGCNRSGVLKSWSDYSVGTGKIDTMRGYCTANGANYQMMCYWQRMLISAYYMMKYGNPDANTVIGAGWNTPSYGYPGGTNSITTATGKISNNSRVKLFGLEDWWGNGNAGEWLDGVYGYYVNTSNNPTSIANRNTSDGNWINPTGGTTYVGGYMKSIIGTNEGMFIPKASGGSTSTFYCDNCDFGGNCYTAGKASAYTRVFNINQGYTPTGNYAIAARLMYL